MEHAASGIVSHLGLIKPKPRIFRENIQYVLVVCTDTEVGALHF